ncbi:MAG TPA: rRNA pseudouridine synthase [Candidatus Onthousia faecavium]|nr:rRNA pseudouridine synthase [Candidatus Onthousia faecavium]
MERLQKVIANSGICSRRKAEELIKEGRVKVNNIIVRELGVKVSSKDKIKVDDKELSKENKVYYLLNKPRGVITSVNDEKSRKTVVDLIPCRERIYPVGRLDYDTTGVLLLTNDGDFANILMHPNDKVEKVYVVKVRGIIKGDSINELKNGVVIDGVKTEKAKVKLRRTDFKSNTSFLTVTIHEGRNHQVKKMFEAVGFPVLKLKREREFIFDLSGLKSGEYRKLTPKEVAIVYSLEKK